MADPKGKKEEIYVNISTKTVIRTIVLIVAAYILFIAARKSTHAIILVFTAFFLSLALNAPVQWLSQQFPGKRRGSRSLATMLSFIIVVAAIGTFIALVTPSLVRNTHTFINNVPHLISEARSKNGPINAFITRYHLQSEANSATRQITARLHNITGPVVSSLTSVAKSLVSIVIILVMTFMMLVEGPVWVRRLQTLMPRKHSDQIARVTRDMYKVVRGFVNGQVVLALIAAVLIMPAVLILHLSNPLALMVIIFLAALVPLIGHPIGAVIITAVALFHSPWAAIIILAYYILYINIESYIIQPKLQANNTNLTPLLVFIAVVVGVSFGGLLGGLVAVPVMGCLRVIVVDYLHTIGKLQNIPATSEPLDETK